MGWLTLVINILKLGGLILGEVFAAKKRAREALEKFELDQKIFNEMVSKALIQMKKDARKESGEARDIEDEIDDEINKNR